MQTLFIFLDDDGNQRAALVHHADGTFEPSSFGEDMQWLRDNVTSWRSDDAHVSLTWPEDSIQPCVIDEAGDEATIECLTYNDDED